jgi:hypothetical protein
MVERIGAYFGLMTFVTAALLSVVLFPGLSRK